MQEHELPDSGTGRALVRARPSAAIDACLRAIGRVEEMIEQETLTLQRHETRGLGDFNHRKSHGLLELTRAIRSLSESEVRQNLADPLRMLQAKLSENSAALQMYLRAVQDVSTILARAIRDGESDGTYSAAIRYSGHRL